MWRICQRKRQASAMKEVLDSSPSTKMTKRKEAKEAKRKAAKEADEAEQKELDIILMSCPTCSSHVRRMVVLVPGPIHGHACRLVGINQTDRQLRSEVNKFYYMGFSSALHS